MTRAKTMKEAYDPEGANQEALKNSLRELFFSPSDEADKLNHITAKGLHMRNIDLIEGHARFLNIDELEVKTGSKTQILEGRNFIIATGSKPAHLPDIAYDGEYVHDVETIFGIGEIPDSILINGAGVIGCQFASLFAMMGAEVTLLCEGERLFPILDAEHSELLANELKEQGIEIVLRDSLAHLVVMESGSGNEIHTTSTNGKQLTSKLVLDTACRQGNTEKLECANAGIELDERGFLKVDKKYKSNVPHIYGLGEVIGSMLDCDSKEQGRKSVSYIFGLEDVEQLAEDFPRELNIIPSVAYYGATEEQLKSSQVQYVVGRSAYSDIPMGATLGLRGGMKLLVNKETEAILGVHIIGREARELVHFGMSLVEERVSVAKIVGTIFNDSSLHELYKIACLDALYRLRGKGA